VQGIYNCIPTNTSLYGTQCRSFSVFTIRATCNAISHVECFALPCQHFPQFVCSAQWGCFLQFLDVVLSGMLFWYCLSDFDMVAVAPAVAVISFLSHSTCAEFLL